MKVLKNKKRWKAGGVLLFLLIAILFGLFSRAYNLKEGLMTFLFFGIPIILVGVIVFLLSLSHTGKRIANKNFSYKWLFGFNFILLIITFLVLEVVGTLIIYFWLLISQAYGDSGMFLLVWWLFAFLTSLGSIILFSLIPSIVLHKIYYNEKAQKKIFNVSIKISILIFVLSIIYLIVKIIFGTYQW